MASDKQKRKAAKKPTPANWVNPDGDRRRREELKKCLKDLRVRQAFEERLQDAKGEEE
jgi:hypothetical protein